MICNALCYLHTISKNCAKYEHTWSNNEGRVDVTSHKPIVDCYYVTLSFDTNGKTVIRNLCCILHPIDNHCAIYEHPRSLK